MQVVCKKFDGFDIMGANLTQGSQETLGDNTGQNKQLMASSYGKYQHGEASQKWQNSFINKKTFIHIEYRL